jgi:hypothetical protein
MESKNIGGVLMKRFKDSIDSVGNFLLILFFIINWVIAHKVCSGDAGAAQVTYYVNGVATSSTSMILLESLALAVVFVGIEFFILLGLISIITRIKEIYAPISRGKTPGKKQNNKAVKEALAASRPLNVPAKIVITNDSKENCFFYHNDKTISANPHRTIEIVINDTVNIINYSYEINGERFEPFIVDISDGEIKKYFFNGSQFIEKNAAINAE